MNYLRRIEPPDYGPEKHVPPRRMSRGLFFSLVVFVLIFVCSATYLALTPTGKFVEPKLIIVASGEPFAHTAKTLREHGIIRSEFALRAAAWMTEEDTHIVAGPYLFDGSDGLISVLRRLSSGNHGIALVRITVPEGYTRAQMAELFSGVLPRFSQSEFLSLTEEEEGFLFPDTYEFFKIATTGEVVAQLRNTFERRTAPLRALPIPGGLSWKEAVILASIVEKEVPLPEDRRIVAGILYKRLSIGMPLQVDAVFKYAIGRGSTELTQEDLRTDSPYNTYTRKGLPPTAIGSPSLDALYSVFQPADSPYLFYLSGTDGTTHFAKNFEEHKRNRERFMR